MLQWEIFQFYIFEKWILFKLEAEQLFSTLLHGNPSLPFLYCPHPLGTLNFYFYLNLFIPDCATDDDCPLSKKCNGALCTDPCLDTCTAATGAITTICVDGLTSCSTEKFCQAINHVATCRGETCFNTMATCGHWTF